MQRVSFDPWPLLLMIYGVSGVFLRLSPIPVFTDSEIKQCGGLIRIPELTMTPSRILLFAQCRHARENHTASNPNLANLGDNMLRAKVVSKASADGGKTWHNWTIHTKDVGHSHGKAIYDRIAKQVAKHNLLGWSRTFHQRRPFFTLCVDR